MNLAAKFYIYETGNLLGYATLTIDDDLVIKGLRLLVNKDDEMFVAFPSVKKSNGEYMDSVYPVTKSLRGKITEVVISAHKKALDELNAKAIDKKYHR